MHEKAIDHLTQADRVMARLIRQTGPCALPRSRKATPDGPFRALVEAVAHQQLTGKAAATILGRMKALFPASPFPSPAELLGLADQQLRTAGFSRAKVAALKDIASRALEGVVPSLAAIRRMNDEAIIERLTAIRGVGQWTVEMLLIFELGRPDILPVDDYGIRKGFCMAYDRADLPNRRELAEFGERWRPYRSVASWYLWRVLDRPAPSPKNNGVLAKG